MVTMAAVDIESPPPPWLCCQAERTSHPPSALVFFSSRGTAHGDSPLAGELNINPVSYSSTRGAGREMGLEGA